ncbi:hypothetical protein BDF20DRAFT_892620 [Mycotypha africana]|uniref:uncharacterized protein n=1 Tax=Mycotypha africana TaxID=64632 RepID=UPI002301180D|nr:uncharacterized protein BDF20DRAFT_892620 [Mycotypha africana]KAI8968974.1 hypothetical protein BDF20DRAFT_892620 [Mycotypha africana]
MLEVNSSPTATNTLTTTLHGNDSSRASHQSSRNISEFTAVTANKGQLPYKTDTKEQSRYSHASEKSREYQFHSDHPITLDSNSDENPDDILMFPIDDASTNNTSNIPFQSSSSSTTTSSTSSHTSSLPPRISNYPQKMISTASFQTSLENRHITIVDPTTTVTVQHSNHHELSVTAVTAIPTGEKFLHLEEIAMVDLFQRKTARVDMLLLLFGFLFFPLWWYGSWRFFMHTEYKQKTAAKHLQLINCFMSLVSLLLLGLMIGLVTVWA